MQIKFVDYLELLQLFLSAERNHLCYFVRGYYEDRFCEMILNLGQWFRRRFLKIFLKILALLFGGREPYMQF